MGPDLILTALGQAAFPRREAAPSLPASWIALRRPDRRTEGKSSQSPFPGLRRARKGDWLLFPVDGPLPSLTSLESPIAFALPAESLGKSCLSPFRRR